MIHGRDYTTECLRFCRFGKRKGGCTKGKSCKYYHPVLCKFSTRSNKCFDSECTYTHLKGTKRSEGGDKENLRHRNAEKKESDFRPQRWRKDSTASVGSRNSEAFRTPFPRKRTESTNEKNHSSSNPFLEKLMENMKKGFEEQKTQMVLLKQGFDKQIGAIWTQMGSINQQSLPQLPLQLQRQLPPQMIPGAVAPWNNVPNPCSMY